MYVCDVCPTLACKGYVCMCVCMYACMYVCMYVCVYVILSEGKFCCISLLHSSIISGVFNPCVSGEGVAVLVW